MTDGVPPPGDSRAVRGGEVTVSAAAGAYPVIVRPGLLEELPDLLEAHAPAHRYAVVSDDRVAGLYGESVARSLEAGGRSAGLFTFPAGEERKTRGTWSRLTDELLDAGLGRDGAVVAVGGGVTGDLGGFVAATLLRGIPVVQVPTSLVAMIDSSVGGKTGVDTPAGKNLVGAFHPPRLVAADPATVRTLPVGERAQGLVEAVKHGAILDPAYFRSLEEGVPDLLAGEIEATTAAVLRSVELKAEVVERDEGEAGPRQILNFGHTLGHALEAAAGYAVSHGTAVGLGMILEARLGEGLGVTEEGTAEALARVVKALGLPVRPPDGLDPDVVIDFTRADKKVRAGTVRYVLLERIGAVAAGQGAGWTREVADGAVEALLREAWEEPAGREARSE